MTDLLLLKRRLRAAALIILASGAVASTIIYQTALPAVPNPLVNEFQDSKAYRHELEAYGGKLGLVADELIRWFVSLWQGESLAFTIAVLSAAIALMLIRAARWISPAPAETGVNITDMESKG